MYVAQAGDAGEHAGAVGVAQAAFDAVSLEQFGADVVMRGQIAA